MSLHMIAYDIGHDGHRRSVARIVLGYGVRIQRSVYEVWLTPKRVQALRRRVAPYLEVDDCFDIVPIDERGSRKRIRWQRKPNHYPPVIVMGPAEDGPPPPGARKFRVDDIPGARPPKALLRKIIFLGWDGKPTKVFWGYPGDPKFGPIHHGTKDSDPHPPPHLPASWAFGTMPVDESETAPASATHDGVAGDDSDEGLLAGIPLP